MVRVIHNINGVNMKFSALAAMACSLFLCAACGGGGDSTADTTAPVVSGVSVSAPSQGQVTLTAVASDALGVVSAYCFQTSATAPASSDACFISSASKNIKLSETASRYYVWAKDMAGNVSATFERTGPCYVDPTSAAQATSLPQVCVSTSLGEYVLALESVKAPITTANFLKYVNDGYYGQTVFHRVISNFMVQGGGFTGVPISASNTKSGTKYPAIALETPASTGLSNTVGTIAMARTSVLNSATSEFFINVVNNTSLDTSVGGYAVFGRVISGLDTTVQSIRNVPVQLNSGGELSQPVTAPVINWAYQLK